MVTVIVSPAPSGAVTDSDFQIVNPLSQVEFLGDVTQIGNVSAATGSAVNTDTLEVSATQVINEGDWKHSGVS